MNFDCECPFCTAQDPVMNRNPAPKISHGICPDCFELQAGRPADPETLARQAQKRAENGMPVQCAWCKVMLYEPETSHPANLEDGYHHNPIPGDEDYFVDQCHWVSMRRRPLRYEQCLNSAMTDGLCLEHYRDWQTRERERILHEDGVDIWSESEDDTKPLFIKDFKLGDTQY